LILYCDTSALIKLYVQEDFTEAVRRATKDATVVAVSRISWAESMAALARRAREQPADGPVIEAVRNNLRADWKNLAIVEITQAVVELAADYADTFALRGYDSVQLACARTLQQAIEEPLCFACFDMRLENAARVLEMQGVRHRA
jgi:uncharacterized protein